MNKLFLSAVAVCSVIGCASNEPQYQVGGPSAERQSRVDAERTHANRIAAMSPVANLDVPPRVLSSRFPDFPAAWRSAGIVGTVIVDFSVEPDGSVSNPAVQGAPPPQLAALTLNAIMQWKFAPATRGGVPVRVKARQQFVFQTE